MQKKNFFGMRVLEQCNRLPRDTVDVLFLETLKINLDRPLSNLMWLKMSLLMSEGVAYKGL